MCVLSGIAASEELNLLSGDWLPSENQAEAVTFFELLAQESHRVTSVTLYSIRVVTNPLRFKRREYGPLTATPLMKGVARSHWRRACGMGDDNRLRFWTGRQ